LEEGDLIVYRQVDKLGSHLQKNLGPLFRTKRRRLEFFGDLWASLIYTSLPGLLRKRGPSGVFPKISKILSRKIFNRANKGLGYFEALKTSPWGALARGHSPRGGPTLGGLWKGGTHFGGSAPVL